MNLGIGLSFVPVAVGAEPAIGTGLDGPAVERGGGRLGSLPMANRSTARGGVSVGRASPRVESRRAGSATGPQCGPAIQSLEDIAEAVNALSGVLRKLRAKRRRTIQGVLFERTKHRPCSLNMPALLLLYAEHIHCAGSGKAKKFPLRCKIVLSRAACLEKKYPLSLQDPKRPQQRHGSQQRNEDAAAPQKT